MGKQENVIYLLALSLQREKFITMMRMHDKQTVVIGDEESNFISYLVLSACFDDTVLHHVFSLPYDLIDQVREVYVH